MIPFSDIELAYSRIKKYIRTTPVLTSEQLNKKFDTEIFFKCENFQKVGAFKARGAHNAVYSLSDSDASKGVATHSSGNHAQALALAAKSRGIKAYIVMPENSPEVKVNAVKSYGAEIIFCEATLKAREEGLQKIVEQTGAYFVPPYNDEKVITGQGTITLEFLNQLKSDFNVSQLDYLLAPVGGGGLLSGTAIACKHLSSNTKVIGVEPEQADDAYQSFKQRKLIPQTNPNTIADGLRTSLGKITFNIIKDNVDEIITVSESSIIEAMYYMWERIKIIIEPSSAVPLAAIFENKIDVKNKKIGIIISGGNVDLKKLPWVKNL